MLYNAKNGNLKLDGMDLDYVRFGSGTKTLLILPGVGDGLQTVKGMALPMAMMYRSFAREFTVYAISRKNHLEQGTTTRDMAHDLAKAMDKLGIQRADVLGVSMGGMIAQHLAIDHPEKVGRLVLVVTCARPNPILTESINEWISLAEQGNHRAFMDSNVQRIYSQDYYSRNKWLVPIMGKLTKPKSYDRFFVQAQACLTHDAYEDLPKIQASTFVIGGRQDRALGGEASVEIAERIPKASLKMYDAWGHGLYDEAKDFNAMVLAYLTK